MPINVPYKTIFLFLVHATMVRCMHQENKRPVIKPEKASILLIVKKNKVCNAEIYCQMKYNWRDSKQNYYKLNFKYHG